MSGSRMVIGMMRELLLLLCTPSASAQDSVMLGRIVTARSLSGVVVDRTGAPVSDATVELCAPDWKNCLVEATAGPDGRFTLVPKQRAHVYFLRVSSNGFNPLEFKVHLARLGHRRLRAELSVAA
jgi:hypothetical protein